jgi:hypothetical protein
LGPLTIELLPMGLVIIERKHCTKCFNMYKAIGNHRKETLYKMFQHVQGNFLIYENIMQHIFINIVKDEKYIM